MFNIYNIIKFTISCWFTFPLNILIDTWDRKQGQKISFYQKTPENAIQCRFKHDLHGLQKTVEEIAKRPVNEWVMEWVCDIYIVSEKLSL